jgi:hypothetical protein
MAYNDSTPYILDEPAKIAMQYEGNKQEIRKAAQMGLVDPTAAVLAGMFIDRMRGAQAMEAAPQQSVADQVFTPPMPPAAPMGTGLGAIPQQAPAMPPAAPAAPAMPTQMVASGGLMGIDVPDNMYEMAGGGIVAFAAGDAVKNPYTQNIKDIQDLYANIPESEEEKAYRAYLQGLPESARKRKQEGIWEAVALGGLTAASQAKPTTGNVLQDIAGALGTAGAAGLPTMAAARKEARAEEAAALRGQAELAKGKRQEQGKAIELGTQAAMKELDREAQIRAANIAAEKPTDLRYYAAMVVKAQKGDPEAKIIVEGIDNYLPQSALGRTAVAAQGVGVQQQRVDLDLYNKAVEYTDSQIGRGGPQYAEFRRLQKLDKENAAKGEPTNLAEEFENEYSKQIHVWRTGTKTSATRCGTCKGRVLKKVLLPMPKRAAEAVAGKVYMTAKGPSTLIMVKNLCRSAVMANYFF